MSVYGTGTHTYANMRNVANIGQSYEETEKRNNHDDS